MAGYDEECFTDLYYSESDVEEHNRESMQYLYDVVIVQLNCNDPIEQRNSTTRELFELAGNTFPEEKMDSSYNGIYRVLVRGALATVRQAYLAAAV